ncbi:MAG TPA: hypothetical protein PKC62_12285 [Ferruginibacter sp.]|nr:hypothetical protein [Ferruginibacter sp.]
MEGSKVFLVLLVALALGYGVHKVIRHFINPRQTPAHFILYLLAHLIAVFTLSFLVNIFVLKILLNFFAT